MRKPSRDPPWRRPTAKATDRRSDRPRKRPTVEAVSKACAAVEAGSSVCTSLPAVSWRLARNVVKPYNCHQIHGFPWRRLFHVSRRVRSMQNVQLSSKSVCWTGCSGQAVGGETLTTVIKNRAWGGENVELSLKYWRSGENLELSSNSRKTQKTPEQNSFPSL